MAGGCSSETDDDQAVEEGLDEIGNVFLPSEFTFDLPKGWEKPTKETADAVVSQFEMALPDDAEGEVELAAVKEGAAGPEALILVTQEPVDEETTLEEYVSNFQDAVSSGSPESIEFGEPTETTLGGDEAVLYEYAGANQQFATLLALHEGNGVTIELVAPGTLEEAAPGFRQILETWEWTLG